MFTITTVKSLDDQDVRALSRLTPVNPILAEARAFKTKDRNKAVRKADELSAKVVTILRDGLTYRFNNQLTYWDAISNGNQAPSSAMARERKRTLRLMYCVLMGVFAITSSQEKLKDQK